MDKQIDIRLCSGKSIMVDYIVNYISIDGRDLSIAYRYTYKHIYTYRVDMHDAMGAVWQCTHQYLRSM